MNEWFEESYDLIIIGGGATGSGIALDSVLRGYKTLLIEKNDFASGSSSKSTKLVHGGIRYLEKAITNINYSQYHLVQEALDERFFFLNNAAHISKSITLLTPIYNLIRIPYIYVGLYLYDFISGKKSFGKSSFVFKDEIISNHSTLKKKNLFGGVKYFDGSFNDSRMVISLLQTAQKYGATVLNYHQVEKFTYKNSIITGVKIKDIINKKTYNVQASSVINATGVYVDEIRKIDDNKADDILEISSGIHIVVDKKYLNSSEGILIPKTKDGRVVFILPWQNYCLIGTTENLECKNDNLEVTNDEIEYLITETNNYLDTKINRNDILSYWKGLRTLIKDENVKDSSNIVREHCIIKSKSNLISIAGGKWTTYRKMAEDVLDFIIKNQLLTYKKECQTKEHKLVGSQNNIRKNTQSNISSEQYQILLNLYGDQIEKVLKIAEEENAYEKINDEFLYIKAQVIYSVRYEYVKKPIDFLLRRTPILLLNKKEALISLEYITKIISKLLSWDRSQYIEELNYAKYCINENRY